MRPSLVVSLLLLVSGALVACGGGGAPTTPPLLVSGTVLDAERVRLVEEERDLVLTATPAANGSFAIAIAAGTASRPRLMVEGAGGSLVVTAPLSLDASLSLPPLRAWRAPIEVKRERDRLRFSWPAIAEGTGSPRQARYSLLFSFPQREGTSAPHGEASLVTRATEAIQSLDDLADLIGERKPGAKLKLVVRAFDSTDPEGATWSGGPTEWEAPPDLPFRERRVK